MKKDVLNPPKYIFLSGLSQNLKFISILIHCIVLIYYNHIK